MLFIKVQKLSLGWVLKYSGRSVKRGKWKSEVKDPLSLWWIKQTKGTRCSFKGWWRAPSVRARVRHWKLTWESHRLHLTCFNQQNAWHSGICGHLVPSHLPQQRTCTGVLDRHPYLARKLSPKGKSKCQNIHYVTCSMSAQCHRDQS